jgi:hypothetical protein
VVSTLLEFGRVATNLGLPLLLRELVSPKRGRAALLLVGPPLEEWVSRRPRLNPVQWVIATVVEDFAHGLGVWYGCARHRTLAPLLPTKSSPVPDIVSIEESVTGDERRASKVVGSTPSRSGSFFEER